MDPQESGESAETPAFAGGQRRGTVHLREIVRIIAACDQIGRAPYERLRSRAMVLLMRYAGLRVSDVVTLSRDHIKGIHLEKRAVKNHRMIRVELHQDVVKALELLPHPKAAARDSRLFFSGGNASLRSLVKGAQRLLAAVFKRAKVDGGHPHRFRHTLASELLGKGANDRGHCRYPRGQPRHDPPALCEVDSRIAGPQDR